MKTSDCFAQVVRGMQLAFFAYAYAEQAEDEGQPMRGEIMDQLPDDIDPAAAHAASTLVADLINAHTFGEKGLSNAQCIGVLYLKATKCDTSGADRELNPELFGHYLAMQAMGSGVGLESFGNDVRDAIAVPYVEFGSHSLERDYFEKPIASRCETMASVREFIRQPSAFPGGYPKVLVMTDGEFLCVKCAKSEYRLISHSTRHNMRDGWAAASVELHMEGPAENCANCGGELESAYGDPAAAGDE